ncbi:MAG: nitroreductase family protein [Gammaproteobacteria bacterium]
MKTDKSARTFQPVHRLIARRWSSRAVDQRQPVERADLVSVLEAARWAPSCFGDQPWRYLVWDRFGDEASWQRAFDCLTPRNREWVRRAPVLLAAVASSRFRRNGKPNRWGGYDTGAASENLCLQATALGLVARQMGGFDAAQLAMEFGIPEDYTPMAMIALGHPAGPETVPEPYQADELAERTRLPFGETCFDRAWENPLDTGDLSTPSR